jgi:membrane protease YdiL (CAAX protease family)
MSTSEPLNTSPLCFFALVFALALPFYLLGALVGTIPPVDVSASALMFPVPLVAAVILVHREHGPDGVRRLMRRVFTLQGLRQHKLWLVPAIFLMPAIALASYGLMRLLERPLPEPEVAYAAIPAYFVLLFVLAVGEEAGWSGYAIDPLQDRWGALKASLVLGAAWGLWHVVPYLQGGPYVARETAVWVVCQAALFTVAARVLIVWLYINTGNSVMAAVLFHAMINVCYVLFPNDGSHYDPAITGAITAAAAAMVTLLWVAKSSARYRQARTAPGAA